MKNTLNKKKKNEEKNITDIECPSPNEENDSDPEKTPIPYSEKFFDYKSFDPSTIQKSKGTKPTTNEKLPLKRKKSPPKPSAPPKTNRDTWIQTKTKSTNSNTDKPSQETLNDSTSKDDTFEEKGSSQLKALTLNDNKITLNTINEELRNEEEENIADPQNLLIKEITVNDNEKSKSSSASLEFNSRVQSKDRGYNFNTNLAKKEDKNDSKKELTKYQEYLLFKKQNTSVNETKKKEKTTLMNQETTQQTNQESKGLQMLKDGVKKDYSLELATFEENYEEFYKLRKGPKNPKNTKRNSSLNYKAKDKKSYDLLSVEKNTARNKKSREKMEGHKCELCQTFYEAVGESGERMAEMCRECSRHRCKKKPNSTPKGFYDLTI